MQVGHVAREHAMVLAPMIDNGRVVVEGVVFGSGSANRYSTGIFIRVYGPASDRKEVSDYFTRYNLTVRIRHAVSCTTIRRVSSCVSRSIGMFGTPPSVPPPQLRPYSDPLKPKHNPHHNGEMTPLGTVIDMSNIQDNLEEIYKQQQNMLKCVIAAHYAFWLERALCSQSTGR